MIAYRRDWLDALEIRDQADYWGSNGLIPEEKVQELHEKYPVGFYSPNWFIRIGLALFGGVIISAVQGLFFLIFSPDLGSEVAAMSILTGGLLLGALEFWLIRSARHYRSGLDDITLYLGGSALIFGLVQLFLETAPFELQLVCWSILLGLGAIRYADTPMTLLSFGCFVAFLIQITDRILGPKGMYLLPWLIMSVAGAAYWLSRKMQQQSDLRFWKTPLVWIEAAALALFYICGNYWVVQGFSSELMPEAPMPLQPLFWILTFAVPAAYLYFGWKKKDRLMLDIGFFCVVAAIATYRYYFHLLAVEWAVTIGGALLLAISWYCIRALKHGHIPGYTYAQDGRDTQLQTLQSQFIEESFGHKPK